LTHRAARTKKLVATTLSEIPGEAIPFLGIPIETPSSKVVDIKKYRWRKYCRGLFELPIGA
jgi:hypothetical protein